MFDFAWSEIGLIAVVALIAIGPKDMPVAIRALTGWIKKARRMAAEFQTHVDEMVRDADLHEVRASINEIRNFDIRGEIERTVDADGSLRATFSGNPLDQPLSTPGAGAAAVTSVEEVAVSQSVAAEIPAPEPEPEPAPEPPAPEPQVRLVQAPAFVPPNLVVATDDGAATTEAPAFIPPNVVAERRPRLTA